MRMSRSGILFGTLLAIAMAVVCAPAHAGLVTSWSERQVVPGLTERTVWSQAQVAVYLLPQNVTHTGDIHIELTYKPVDRACLVFLLDEKGAVCAGTELQGQPHQINRAIVVDGAFFAFGAAVCRGRKLPLGQTIDAIVLNNVGHAHAAPHRIGKLPQAN